MYDFKFIIIVRCDRDIVLPVYESHWEEGVATWQGSQCYREIHRHTFCNVISFCFISSIGSSSHIWNRTVVGFLLPIRPMVPPPQTYFYKLLLFRHNGKVEKDNRRCHRSSPSAHCHHCCWSIFWPPGGLVVNFVTFKNKTRLSFLWQTLAFHHQQKSSSSLKAGGVAHRQQLRVVCSQVPQPTCFMTVGEPDKVEAGQESTCWGQSRTEEGRKPVLFGNQEKNKEALLNRKRDRERRGKLKERQLYYWYMYDVFIIHTDTHT